MTPEQKAAYINSQIVCAQARIEGMKAFNHERAESGLALAYDEAAFDAIPDEFGISHNAVCAFFQGD